MSKSIQHLPFNYSFDNDLSIEALVLVLREVATEMFGDLGCTLDLTTMAGDYYYDISFDELEELFIQFKETVNSITLSEITEKGKMSAKSIVVYLNNSPGSHDISITIVSDSEDENKMMTEVLTDKINLSKNDYLANTREQLNDSFLFDPHITANNIIAFIEKISIQFLPDIPFVIDVLTIYEQFLNMNEGDMDRLKNIIRKQDHHLISIYKVSSNGSLVDINLYFHKGSAGFCYFSFAGPKREPIEFIQKLIHDDLKLSAEGLLSYKKELISRPQLQRTFEIDSRLTPDDIIDGIQAISMQFLGAENLELKLIRNNVQLGCYADYQCHELRAEFRNPKEGILLAVKIEETGHAIAMIFQFRSKMKTNAFYFLALRSENENEAVSKYIARRLGFEEASDQHSDKVIKPQLQEAFYFDKGIEVKSILEFLNSLSNTFLSDEILTVRLTTVSGKEYFFYDDENVDIDQYFRNNLHDLLYINLKEASGRHISIHLQFKSDDAGANGYYSIVMDDENENEKVKDFISNNLKSRPALSNLKSTALTKEIDNFEKGAADGTFRFNNEIGHEELLNCLHDVSEIFQPDLNMTIRVMTSQREEFVFLDDEMDILLDLLNNNQIDYLFAQKGFDTPYKLTLYLQFGEDSSQSGYYSINSGSKGGDIRLQELMLGCLEAAPLRASPDYSEVLKGKFRFPENISADRIIAFMNAMIRKNFNEEKFVKNKRFNFNIRNFDGTTHVNLDYHDFRTAFVRERNWVHILSVASITFSGKYIELAFIFGEERSEPNGHFSIKSGSEKSNELIRDFILKTFPEKSTHKAKSNNPKKLGTEINEKQNKSNLNASLNKVDDKSARKFKVFMDSTFEVDKSQIFLSLGLKRESESKLKDLLIAVIEKNEMTWIMPQGLDGFNVLAEIWKSVNESSVVVVDISAGDISTFYELGIAHSLGKRVIILTNDGSKLPFDFKHIDHIIYSRTKKGLERLGEEFRIYLTKKD